MLRPASPRRLPRAWLLALGALALPSVASAQQNVRVLVLHDGPSDARDVALRDRLEREPGVRSVAIAGAPLSDLLLAAGCGELTACAPTLARAAGADLLVVRDASPALRVIDPAAPGEVRTVEDPAHVVATPPPAPPAVRPMTWALGAGSLALFLGAGVAGGLSIASMDSLEAGPREMASELVLLARAQAEATTAYLLLGAAVTTAVMTIVLAVFDLSSPPPASIAILPDGGGGRAEVRVRF